LAGSASRDGRKAVCEFTKEESMKISKKVWFQTMVAGAVGIGLMGVAVSSQAGEYKGTAYVAGMGGHFAKAEISIDPTEDVPIVVDSLDKIDIGDGETHPTHDARIDYKDKNLMFWSTYHVDHSAKDQTHIGKTDLTTGEVITDVTVPTPANVVNNGHMYCASGQTKDYYFPISMAKPGYISVVRKKDMKVMHQVFLEGTDADIKVPYKYMHGVSSPDMKEFFITLNESDTPGKDYGHTVGKLHMFLLDAAALEQGKVKVLAKGIADGNQDSTISFRQYFSPDGKYIANATGDILFLIDAKTLKVLDAETVGPLEQLHDAIFTPDSKYVVATSRSKDVFPECDVPAHPKPNEYLMDGRLKLYDVEARKFIGRSTSTCLACHDQELGRGQDAVHAVLCGIDVNWKK